MKKRMRKEIPPALKTINIDSSAIRQALALKREIEELESKLVPIKASLIRICTHHPAFTRGDVEKEFTSTGWKTTVSLYCTICNGLIRREERNDRS